MKKLLAIVVLGLLWCNISIAEEYPNSWKMDIKCKQKSSEWYEESYKVFNRDYEKISIRKKNNLDNKYIPKYSKTLEARKEPVPL